MRTGQGSGGRRLPARLLTPPAGLTETTLERSVRFEGRIVRLHVDRVRLPDGREGEREVVDHPGAVAILPITAQGRVVLVWQYRQAAGRAVLEIPAGKLSPGESPAACARRELAEETGMRARRLRAVGRFLPSPGFSGEWLHLYVATGLVPGPPRPDPDEWLAAVEATPEEVDLLLARGRLEDLKTLAALAWWRREAT
ncbi:MAG: NUDIX hydrolase [Firmicutes bacterium]|nr:NUDIX hydrolase [Bacillota bacterium]